MKNSEWFKRKLEAVRGIGYVFGDNIRSVKQRFGISPTEILKLDSNENFFVSKEELAKLIMEVVQDFDPRLYPQEEVEELREKIGAYINVSANSVAVGNGSDELMERIARLFLEPGEQALTVYPTFSMYRHAVTLQKAELIEVPLRDDFSLDVEALMSRVTSKTRVIFLCSPNNPTANQFKMEKIGCILETFRKGVVVLDEAYAEFAGTSAVWLTEKFDNLIVLRTFSKAFGLAGLRLGYCVADEEIANVLARNVGLPYPVNTIALRVGVKLLENLQIMKRAVKELQVERGKLIEALNGIHGVKAFDSQTNFILFRTEKSADEVYNRMLRKGIIVKNLGTILKFDNCFRATVGTPKMNERLILALKEICEHSEVKNYEVC